MKEFLIQRSFGNWFQGKMYGFDFRYNTFVATYKKNTRQDDVLCIADLRIK